MGDDMKCKRYIIFFFFCRLVLWQEHNNACDISQPWFLKDTLQINNDINNSYQQCTMPPMWYQHLYQLMKDVHEIFSYNKLEYWIQGGTLLGAVRHNGIIPWDDDIDINIKKKDEALFLSLIPLLKRLGYTVEPVWFGYKIAVEEVFELGELKGSPCIDIFFTIENGDKIYYDKHWMIRDDEPIYVTKEELYPLRIYQLGTVCALGPNNPVPYLDASFTPDWPYFGRIWNHFIHYYEERWLTQDDLVAASLIKPLEDHVNLYQEASVRVYASMVADLFHYGHVEFLKKAHTLGTTVIVGLIPDDVAAAYKRMPILCQEERAKVLAGCKYVDEIIFDAPLIATKEFIEDHAIDYVVHGDDFNKEKLYVYFSDAIAMGIMRILNYTSGISTSLIIERIRKGLL
jgi:cytidyltransferase-like protein